MAQGILVTKNGLFVNLGGAAPLLSVAARDALKSALEHPAVMEGVPERQRAAVRSVLEASDHAPIQQQMSWRAPNNTSLWRPGDRATRHTTITINGHVHSVTPFLGADALVAWDLSAPCSNSSQCRTSTGSPQAWGWEIAKKIKSVHTTLGAIVRLAALDVHLPPPEVLSRFARLADLWRKGDLSLQQADPARDFAVVESFAVFCPATDRRPGGYLDKKNNPGPLAAARLFESAAAARRQRGAAGRSADAVVVTIEARLSGVVVEPGRSTDNQAGFEGLHAAVALVERRALDQAREESSATQTRRRLEDLESEVAALRAQVGAPSPTEDADETPPARGPRRM